MKFAIGQLVTDGLNTGRVLSIALRQIGGPHYRVSTINDGLTAECLLSAAHDCRAAHCQCGACLRSASMAAADDDAPSYFEQCWTELF